MSLQPHQIRDLIIDTAQKIKQLQEKFQLTKTEIKEIYKRLRSEHLSDDIDTIEKNAISELEKIYKIILAQLEKLLVNLKVQREQMLKDLELPPDVEI